MIERKDVLRLRRQMPVTGELTYLNWGHSGPSPRPFLKAMQRVLENESRLGPSHEKIRARRDEVLATARALLAKVIGAGAADITLTDNATTGINIAAGCLDWKRGDEVVISNAEHPGGYLPWFVLRDRRGIKVHQIPVTGSDERFLSALERKLNRRTRLICLSHVAWLSGYCYPVQRVADLARSRGIFFLVDGAQSVGALHLNVKRLGCDFYAFPGQKWLLGPQGTGALYVRPYLRGKLPLPGAGYESAIKKDLATSTYTPFPDGRRYELATRSTALFAGLAKGAEQALGMGLARIERRVLSLAGRLMDRLERIPGLELLSFRPEGGRAAHSGLVSLRVPETPAAQVVDHLLKQEKILVREVAAYPPGVRVSLHYLNLEEEVDRAAEAVERLCRRTSKAGRAARRR